MHASSSAAIASKVSCTLSGSGPLVEAPAITFILSVFSAIGFDMNVHCSDVSQIGHTTLCFFAQTTEQSNIQGILHSCMNREPTEV